MPITPVLGMPGVRTAVTATPRSILYGADARILPGGRIIDGTKSRDPGNTGDVGRLRCGLLMGRITTGGLYRPSVIGVNTVAYADNDTTITVAAATATEIARLKALGGGGDLSLKFVGPPTANGTVAETAITVTAVGATTITVGDLNLAKVAGSFLTPADGAETPVAFVLSEDPLSVTDADGNSVATVPYAEVPVAGTVDSSQLLPAWPSDTSLQAWIVAGLNAASGGQFVFDHRY